MTTHNTIPSPTPETSAEEIARYVQPRYRQARQEVIAKLEARLATDAGSFPQLVDPSILVPGDTLCLVRAIETLPLMEFVIGNTRLETNPVVDGLALDLDARIEVTSTKYYDSRDEERDPFPEEISATAHGFARLNRDGQDAGDPHFAYTNVFLINHT